MRKPRSLTLFTHRAPEETAEAVHRLIEMATEAGVEVRVPENEVTKHGLSETPGVVLGADPDGGADLAAVLGGDGTILEALRVCAASEAPVFAINFGQIGFLATVDQDQVEEGLRRAISGDYDVLPLPALSIDTQDGAELGVNDISFHRRPESRVAELAYSVDGEQLGRVRCDGVVASTPAGSTGYNLANGGPVLAWGVEGFVVSFIAPHTLTARALVVAPDGVLSVLNLSERESVDVTTDGRNVAALGPGEEIDVRFEHARVRLAQVKGTSFYHRLREKFGRLG